MEEREIYLAFALLDGIGPVRFKLLVDYFGSAQKAWTSSKQDLIALNITAAKAEHIVRFRENFDSEKEQKKLDDNNMWFVAPCDREYPEQLQNFSDKPIVLFGKGDKKLFLKAVNNPCVAVVGSRKMTAYGKHITGMIVQGLTTAGCTIVSGLMYGVDEAAHWEALNTNGLTIGVWAGGIDTLTGSRGKLATAVAEKGSILSEFPLGLTPSKGTFPARNRIVSGLSKAVVVVEGDIDSGSLITARIAAEQGREVFAVPGAVTSPLSQGPLSLIKQGAKIATSAVDILEELHIKSHKPSAVSYQPGNENERKVLDVLKNENFHVDAILHETKLPQSTVSATLSMLELNGIVKQYGGGEWGLV